ncbi:Crp/Fnr family transcriptional regulator [Algoriphagus formosus]|uniref:Crp/Fnr family transcriptional regulator n=1 Tax=Algoriphagus formosus TaxID=2007308 RepID=A0A4R5V7F8_9BACT|nr:Crp/Fnr family transcriptional regulator [Algoriphagus aquimaris]TDK47929.1 Crp/Fnr family transcriptional regulator [Algoriphagus aquimaris]
MDIHLFELISKHQDIQITDEISDLEAERGTVLYQPPQRLTPIFEIIQGAVRIGTYSPMGEEVCYDLLKEGDFFGNLQYLNGQFSEFAKSLTRVKLRQYDVQFFKHVCSNIPEASSWFSQKLVSRWCRAEDRLFAVRSMEPKEKVRRILAQFQEKFIDTRGKTYTLSEFLTLQDIADLTGMTRQTVSKSIKELVCPAKTIRKKVK